MVPPEEEPEDEEEPDEDDEPDEAPDEDPDEGEEDELPHAETRLTPRRMLTQRMA